MTSRRWHAALDGFTLVAVCGLALVHLLPEALAAGGLTAGAFALVGVSVPWAMHRFSGAEHRESTVLVAGLALHAAAETAVLGASPEGHALALGAAIVFHRLPLGMVVFASAEASHGERRAWLFIAVLVVATVVGFLGGETLAASFDPHHYAWLQALVAGSLLHVAFGHEDHSDHHHESQDDDDHHHHHHHHDHDQDHDHDHHHAPTWETVHGALGGIVGLATVIVSVVYGHDHDQDHAGGDGFLHIALKLSLESAPALLLAYVLAGLVRVAVTPATVGWLQAGSRTGQSLRGVLFGLPLPICSCGVLPLYASLIERGVPATAALAFLIATPELGLDAIILSFPLLGVELTTVRLVAAFAIAFLVAIWVGRRMAAAASPNPIDPTSPSPRPGLRARVAAGVRFGLVELFDHTMPWIVVGLLIAAVAQPILSQAWLTAIPSAAQVPLFALIGIPMYVCASGATPIAAVLIASGVSPGAALAFLLAGPATNLTTFGILASLHGRRIAFQFGIGVTIAAVAAGWAMMVYWERQAMRSPCRSTPMGPGCNGGLLEPSESCYSARCCGRGRAG